jgi:hypothetical protein
MFIKIVGYWIMGWFAVAALGLCAAIFGGVLGIPAALVGMAVEAVALGFCILGAIVGGIYNVITTGDPIGH